MKPCICGSTNVTIVQTTHAQTKQPVYQPFCEQCLLLGSPQPSRTEAINRWDDQPLIDQLTKLITTPLPDLQCVELTGFLKEHSRQVKEAVAKIKGETK